MSKLYGHVYPFLNQAERQPSSLQVLVPDWNRFEVIRVVDGVETRAPMEAGPGGMVQGVFGTDRLTLEVTNLELETLLKQKKKKAPAVQKKPAAKKPAAATQQDSEDDSSVSDASEAEKSAGDDWVPFPAPTKLQA